MAGAVLGEGQVSLFVAGAVLGEVQVLLFVVGAVFGEVQVLLFVVQMSLFGAGAVLGEGQVSLFVAGAVLGEVQVLLFVVGAVFGEVQVLLFVVGAVFGEGKVLLFVAGAALGECLNVRLGSKRCILQWKMLLGSSKSNLTCEAGCGFRFHARIILGSFSDHARIVPALEMTFHLFSANFCQMVGGHFAWQAQYLVSLEGDIGCSAHCK